jgi:hypothetical protein
MCTFPTVYEKRPSFARKITYCNRTFFGNMLISKKTASPQLRAVRSQLCTIERRLNAVHASRVLTVRHKTRSKGPFKKPLLKGGRLLLQKSSRKPCEQPTTEIIVSQYRNQLNTLSFSQSLYCFAVGCIAL